MEEGAFTIDCSEPVASKLIEVHKLQDYLEISLQPKQQGRGTRTPRSEVERQTKESVPNKPPKPSVVRCGAQVQHSIGGMSPRVTTPRTPRATPRAPSSKATTPRRSVKPATPRSKASRASLREEAPTSSSWEFKAHGKQLQVLVPPQAQNGRRLVESMLRRFLQRQCLLSRVEMHRAHMGGIVLKVDSQKILRELSQLQEEEEANPIGNWEPRPERRIAHPIPSQVRPLRFDALRNIEEQHQAQIEMLPNSFATPRGPWLQGMGTDPHEVLAPPAYRPHETSPTQTFREK